MKIKSLLVRLVSPRKVSTAATAYLIGPGTLRVSGQVPVWQPVTGDAVRLQPKYLERIVFLGTADVSGVTFNLLWQHGVRIVFLNSSGTRITARVDPGWAPSPLTRFQFAAAQDQGFTIQRCRELVAAKIHTTIDAARYYQQQGKGDSEQTKRMLAFGLAQLAKLDTATTPDAIRGFEGSVAAIWWRCFASLLPKPWEFKLRQSHPSPDPINALLSFGYTLLLARAQTRFSGSNYCPIELRQPLRTLKS